jgi:hypothetical protein
MTPEVRAGLIAHRDSLLAGLSVPKESEDPVPIEDRRIRTVRILLDWLWYVATESHGGTVFGTRQETWDVKETVWRLLFASIDDHWRDEAMDFYSATRASFPSWKSIDEVSAERQRQVLDEDDAEELQGILDDFARGMDSADQDLVDEAWLALNEFNDRTGRAKKSHTPLVGSSERHRRRDLE